MSNGETDVKAVEIDAEIRKIATMADHTINLTLNLPEGCLDQVRALLSWHGLTVRCVLMVTGSADVETE